MMVGPEGGELLAGGATLTIPAGALSSMVEIVVTETMSPTPAGFTAYSPLYEFEPEGLTFEAPVEIEIAYVGDQELAGLFWTDSASSGWERVGGLPGVSTVRASVQHFSRGFIADAVSYADPPDLRCVETRLLEDGGHTGSPSNVTLFFDAEDCQGRPITGLTEPDFRVVENDAALSSEASLRILPQAGLSVFVTLLIDMSSSTAAVLPQVSAALEALLDRLEGLPVHVSVELFSGAPAVDVYATHRLDEDPGDGVAFGALRARLAELDRYAPVDPSSTNLYGAVTQSLQNLSSAQHSFRERNFGGAWTTGYVVLFTDGGDTAGLVSIDDAVAAAGASANQIVAVGLGGDDFSSGPLEALAPNATLIAPDPATLSREFASLGVRIAGQASRTYVLSYCSPRRTGTHTVAAEVAAAGTHRGRATYEFVADGFEPGCDATAIENVCARRECGGLGCGACDERVASCDGRNCIDNCVAQGACGVETITNPAGYQQTCEGPPELRSCVPGAECTDTSSDPSHCGGCGIACAPGAPCQAGTCGCALLACPDLVELALGARFSCVRRATGRVICWGQNTNGQLGDGTTTSRHEPAEVSGLTDATQLAAGTNHICAVRASGGVACWGSNSSGQIGIGTVTPPMPSPRAVVGIGDAVQVSAGSDHTCALSSTGTVSCWGDNRTGELGDGTTGGRSSLPVAVVGLSDAVQVQAFGGATCALRATGAVVCWGQGALGTGVSDASAVPVEVAGVSEIAELSWWLSEACARTRDGGVVCWSRPAPEEIVGADDVVQLAGVFATGCVRQSSGRVQCIGANTWGQLGDGTRTERSGWTTVVDLDDAVDLQGGSEFFCARRATGAVVCWGRNDAGQLGEPTTVLYRPSPTVLTP